MTTENVQGQIDKLFSIIRTEMLRGDSYEDGSMLYERKDAGVWLDCLEMLQQYRLNNDGQLPRELEERTKVKEQRKHEAKQADKIASAVRMSSLMNTHRYTPMPMPMIFPFFL